MKLRRQQIGTEGIFKPRCLNSAAFSLIEMTVVLGLAVILIAIILPSLRGFGEGNTMSAATRQMLDDVAYARQLAIKNHTRVYMVFLPGQFWTNFIPSDSTLSGFTTNSKQQVELLLKHQYTSYALFSFHRLGDQPGQESPRYLSKWKELPEGAIIETNKFVRTESFPDFTNPSRVFDVRRFNYRLFPFPPSELTNAVPKVADLPYIAFDSRGSLFNDLANRIVHSDNISDAEDELIPLARGSIFYPQDANGKPLMDPPDVVEKGYREAGRVNFNLIRIDRLTGRAKLEQPELR